MERPRQKGTATTPPTSRSSWPRRRGTHPACPRRAARRRGCASADGIARGRGGRPRLPQHHRRGRRAGRGRRRHGRRRCGVRPTQTLAGSRINVEFISANPTGPLHLGGTPAGPSSATPSPGCCAAAGAEVAREFYINDRGVQMDHFASLDGGRALGQPVPGGRLPRRVHRRHRPQVVASTSPGIARPARRGARWSPSARSAYDLQLDEQQEQLRRLRHPLRRVVLRAARCTSPARSPGHRAAARSGPPLRGRRRAVDAHRPTSATTRTGC